MTGLLPRRLMVAGSAAAAVLPMLPRVRKAQAQVVHGQGQAWPSQPVKLVVPFAPGGTTDLVARILSQGLQERLGQPVIIENRPGAGAMVGSQAVAQAAPDGHTLLISNIASHAISPALYPQHRYDPVRDFTHIALVISNPSVLVANKAFPHKTLPEIVAAAKRGGLDVASSGAGSSNHLVIIELGNLTGAPFHHIPYRGAGPAMTDVIAGVVPMMADSLPSAAAHIRQGAVRAVAMTSPERHPSFPDVPTCREQGVDLVSASWFGLSGPAGLPPAVLARLHAETMAVLAQPAIRSRFAELGGTPGAFSPEAYAAFVAEEACRWPALVRASGAKVE